MPLNIRPVVSAPLGETETLSLGRMFRADSQLAAAPSSPSSVSSFSLVRGRPHQLVRCLTDLVAFGSFYARHVEALTGSVNDAKDADKVSKVCYAAAIIYAGFIAFCGLQVGHIGVHHTLRQTRAVVNDGVACRLTHR
jgi:hypothetical protein